MKIFAYGLREFDEKPYFDEFCEQYRMEYDYTTEYLTKENVFLCHGFDAISVLPTILDKPMLDLLYQQGIRYIATRSIGTDHIDLSYCEQLGIGVCRAEYPSDCVADYTIMLILMCLRKTMFTLNCSKVQNYTLEGKTGITLNDCTVGIIGTGKIGQAVIQRLRGFGCKIIGYDLYRNADVDYVSLEELYAQSDIISLHMPATEQNYHLLNADAFGKMKDGVVIINTARGSLIDTGAIIDAIEAKKVSAAGLDVVEEETGLYFMNKSTDVLNKRNMSILQAFQNVIVTPHIAFYTETTVKYMVYHSVKGVYDNINHTENPLIVLKGK
ncbi:MAG: lactate dehydrogenase [Erysipelotrichaceae bacterium]|nr:lactate dehydrogenase [Erysipelotrichaceae bacterium]